MTALLQALCASGVDKFFWSSLCQNIKKLACSPWMVPNNEYVVRAGEAFYIGAVEEDVKVAVARGTCEREGRKFVQGTLRRGNSMDLYACSSADIRVRGTGTQVFHSTDRGKALKRCKSYLSMCVQQKEGCVLFVGEQMARHFFNQLDEREEDAGLIFVQFADREIPGAATMRKGSISSPACSFFLGRKPSAETITCAMNEIKAKLGTRRAWIQCVSSGKQFTRAELKLWVDTFKVGLVVTACENHKGMDLGAEILFVGLPASSPQEEVRPFVEYFVGSPEDPLTCSAADIPIKDLPRCYRLHAGAHSAALPIGQKSKLVNKLLPVDLRVEALDNTLVAVMPAANVVDGQLRQSHFFGWILVHVRRGALLTVYAPQAVLPDNSVLLLSDWVEPALVASITQQ